jgi:hypothetical protein
MSPTFRAAASMLLTWCKAYRMIETETTAEVERTRMGHVRSGTGRDSRLDRGCPGPS